jgi:hypothetical protein
VLRILATKQSDWSKRLQAIAMSHRATATCSTGLSPYEVAFGKPMHLFIDRGLLSEQIDSPSLQAYMRDVAPKLTILQDIVMQKATESAARHRKNRNINAKPPSFKIADQVLLFDPTSKTGQNPKLKRKWTGSYLITEVLDNFNFKLQELETGKVLRRPVHADRLRGLSNFRTTIVCSLPTLYDKSFSARQRSDRLQYAYS